MTYADPALRQLQTYLSENGIRVLGIVGDTAHRRGYHVGKDRIFSAGGQGWQDYSVRRARDRAGLSNAAEAIDIGWFDLGDRDLTGLLRHLRAEAAAGRARDIREIISERVDGSQIYRVDFPSGAVEGLPGSNERPHHGHVSYYRDSEGREKRGPYKSYIAGLPDTSTEEAVYSIKGVPGPFPCTVKAGTPHFSSPEDTVPDGTLDDPARPFMCVGETKDGARRYIYGRMTTTAERSRLALVPSTAVNRG